jgi:DNA-binding beta-propeller fold protein YncE
VNDANAFSMDDAFTVYPNLQPYDAIIPGVLCEPPVDPALVPKCSSPLVKKTRPVPSLHTGPWWLRNSKHMVFNQPDRNDPVAFNRLLWTGLVGDVPYPDLRGGEDLSLDRQAVLATYKVPVPLQ